MFNLLFFSLAQDTSIAAGFVSEVVAIVAFLLFVAVIVVLAALFLLYKKIRYMYNIAS